MPVSSRDTSLHNGQERIILPPRLPQDLLHPPHKPRVLRQPRPGGGSLARAGPAIALPQQGTRLVLVLLRNQLPALLAHHGDKQRARRGADPPRMHGRGHKIQAIRLAPRQPAAPDGLLAQRLQAGDVTQIGRHDIAQVGGAPAPGAFAGTTERDGWAAVGASRRAAAGAATGGGDSWA